MKKKRHFFHFLLLNLATSCLFIEPIPKDWEHGMSPRPLTGLKNFPSAKTSYGKGFRDGCKAGWSRAGKGLMADLETKYDFKRQRKSPDYGVGWFDGLEQCTYIIDWDVP